MVALLDCKDSWVAAYATPKLLMASVNDVVDASSLAAAMPYPCCDAGVAVNAAMFTAVSQKVRNAAKLIKLLTSSPHVIWE
jgi:hypothetical protein